MLKIEHRDYYVGQFATSLAQSGEYEEIHEIYGAVVQSNEKLLVKIDKDINLLTKDLYNDFEAGSSVSMYFLKKKQMQNTSEAQIKEFVNKFRIELETKMEDIIFVKKAKNSFLIGENDNGEYEILNGDGIKIYANKYFPSIYEKWWRYNFAIYQK